MSVKDNTLYCDNSVCMHPQQQLNLVNCEICGQSLGAPNVNIISTVEEKTALQRRYDNSKEFLVRQNRETVLDIFEEYFKDNSRCVINLDFEALQSWLIDSNGAYKSYYRLVEQGTRNVANTPNDNRRNAYDSILFGSYKRDIVFGAISLTNRGLVSYGTCTVVLNDLAVINRASLLEENTYKFILHHNINLETLELPLGYRSSWPEKLKLAVAKIYQKLDISNVPEDFNKFVLFSDGDRITDEFIEVHIYKELSPMTIKSVYIPSLSDRIQQLQLKAIQSKYPGKINVI